MLVVLFTFFLIFSFYFFQPKKDIKVRLQEYIQVQKQKEILKDISLYVKSLKTEKSLGIQENKEYYAASLQKLPILFIFLSEAEKDPAILKKELIFTEEIYEVLKEQNQYPPIIDPLIINQRYTVEDLLSRLIVFSDNYPLILFDKYLPNILYKKDTVLSKIRLLQKGGDVRYFSTFDYSKLFFHLYHSSILSKEMSEKALDMLSKADFKKGLVAGIPGKVKVAHKFGIQGNEGEEVELSDCGIVYSDSPYSICVITLGTHVHDLEEVIKNISTIVYKNF